MYICIYVAYLLFQWHVSSPTSTYLLLYIYMRSHIRISLFCICHFFLPLFCFSGISLLLLAFLFFFFPLCVQREVRTYALLLFYATHCCLARESKRERESERGRGRERERERERCYICVLILLYILKI
jgi:hypothetical protein